MNNGDQISRVIALLYEATTTVTWDGSLLRIFVSSTEKPFTDNEFADPHNDVYSYIAICMWNLEFQSSLFRQARKPMNLSLSLFLSLSLSINIYKWSRIKTPPPVKKTTKKHSASVACILIAQPYEARKRETGARYLRFQVSLLVRSGYPLRSPLQRAELSKYSLFKTWCRSE